MSSSELPTASEILLGYFNESDFLEYAKVKHAREDRLENRNEFSDLNCDTKLFPYRVEGPSETPIPTLQDILAAWEVSKHTTKEHTPTKVWRVGAYMVKVGTTIEVLQEAENLIYLEKNSTVRTPKVYAAFASQDIDPFGYNDVEITATNDRKANYYYIVMEFIEGDRLEDVAEELKQNMGIRKKIGDQLGEQLRRLRSVPPEDANHFGRINSGAYPYYMPPIFYPPGPKFDDYGPFDYETLVERLINAAKIDSAMSVSFGGGDYHPFQRIMYTHARSTLIEAAKPSDRIPVLSHIDLQDHNIIAKFVRNEEGKMVDVTEVVLIDWATMCWMPPWYDAAAICRHLYSAHMFYSTLAKHALPVMGNVNMGLVAYFAIGIEHQVFWLLCP